MALDNVANEANSSHTITPRSSSSRSFGNYCSELCIDGERQRGFNIGQGSYGRVKKWFHRPTNQEIAIKIIDKAEMRKRDEDHEGDEMAKLMEEVNIMKRLDHPFVAKMFEFIDQEGVLCITMEYAYSGDLRDFVDGWKGEKERTKKAPSERNAQYKFRQMVLAVEYLHSIGIVHRDIKVENFLLVGNDVRLADFGFATYYMRNQQSILLNTFPGSPQYAAPELHRGTPYMGPPADMWSLGVCLYYLVSFELPFDGKTAKQIGEKVNSADMPIFQFVSNEAESLIKKLLIKEPRKRRCARDVMLHEWVNRRRERLAQCTNQPNTTLKQANLDAIVSHPMAMEQGITAESLIESLRAKKFDAAMGWYLILGQQEEQQAIQAANLAKFNAQVEADKKKEAAAITKSKAAAGHLATRRPSVPASCNNGGAPPSPSRPATAAPPKTVNIEKRSRERQVSESCPDVPNAPPPHSDNIIRRIVGLSTDKLRTGFRYCRERLPSIHLHTKRCKHRNKSGESSSSFDTSNTTREVSSDAENTDPKKSKPQKKLMKAASVSVEPTGDMESLLAQVSATTVSKASNRSRTTSAPHGSAKNGHKNHNIIIETDADAEVDDAFDEEKTNGEVAAGDAAAAAVVVHANGCSKSNQNGTANGGRGAGQLSFNLAIEATEQSLRNYRDPFVHYKREAQPPDDLGQRQFKFVCSCTFFNLTVLGERVKVNFEISFKENIRLGKTVGTMDILGTKKFHNECGENETINEFFEQLNLRINECLNRGSSTGSELD